MARVSQGRGSLFGLVFLLCAACSGSKPAEEQEDTGTGSGETAEDSAEDSVDSAPDSDTGEAPDWPSGARVLDDVRVIDASGVREGAAVVLSGETIWAVTDAGQDWPADATVVDLDGASVLPGLIDSHVHLFLSGSTYWVGDTLADNLSAQLAWGVVAVADLGAPTEVFALRDRVAAGEIRGPRIFATGPFLTAEGSHPCETVNDPAYCTFVEGDGAEAVAAREQADGIKVALADAAFSPWPTPRLDLGDLAEITAAAGDKPVFAHIDAEADATDALEGGVAVLAHPVFGEVVASMPDGPTISTAGAFSGTPDLLDGELLAADLSQTPDAVVAAWTWLAAHPEVFADGWIEASEEWKANAEANLGTAVAEGRTLLAGSDAGYYFVPHGLGLHRELEALVAAGMTPLEAIAAATSEPAALFGWTDLGFVAAGYRADLLVVDGRPDEDIADTQKVRAIYLGGEPWTAEESWVSSGEAAAGAFCLDARDCATGTCDLVDHTCTDACDTPYDRYGSCDEESFCLPADGLDSTSEGACHSGDACDLYAQDCEPSSYGENCAPVDLDTNQCWPAGPQTAGQTCSWSDPDLYCAQGLFCSWITYRCYALCDPDDASACPGCTRQSVEGHPWFGLCL